MQQRCSFGPWTSIQYTQTHAAEVFIWPSIQYTQTHAAEVFICPLNIYPIYTNTCSRGVHLAFGHLSNIHEHMQQRCSFGLWTSIQNTQTHAAEVFIWPLNIYLQSVFSPLWPTRKGEGNLLLSKVVKSKYKILEEIKSNNNWGRWGPVEYMKMILMSCPARPAGKMQICVPLFSIFVCLEAIRIQYIETCHDINYMWTNTSKWAGVIQWLKNWDILLIMSYLWV